MVTRLPRPLALSLAVLAFCAPIVQAYAAQQASRVALTAAVVDDGTILLDGYEHVLGVDRARHAGHTLSDKAPGQPMLAAPSYAVYRAVGGEPIAVRRFRWNLGLWIANLATVVVPAAVLAALVLVDADRVDRRHAGWAATAISFGTLLLPFSTVLFGHVATALLLVLGVLVLERCRGAGALAVGGLLLGLAVVVEYPTALALPAVLAFAAWRHRWRAAWVAVGGVAPAVALAAYLDAGFGSPLRLSYRASAFGPHDRGLGGLPPPTFDGTVEMLLGARGLLTWSPVLVLAGVGAVLLWRRPGWRPRLLLTLGVVVPFALLMAGWSNPTGGDSPGPRYLIPALPFLAAPLCAGIARLPRMGRLLTAASVAAMAAVSLLDPLVERDADAVQVWAARALEADVVDTLLTPVVGAWGILPGTLVAGALLALVLRPVRSVAADREWS